MKELPRLNRDNLKGKKEGQREGGKQGERGEKRREGNGREGRREKEGKKKQARRLQKITICQVPPLFLLQAKTILNIKVSRQKYDTRYLHFLKKSPTRDLLISKRKVVT